MKTIQVGSREVGDQRLCFIAAEIGINHNGDLELAKKMVIAAAESGADAVKFQNYRTEDFLYDRSLTFTYKSQGNAVTESQWEMFKRYEPSPEWWPEIKRLCDDLGIVFFSTPTSEEGVDELVNIGASLLKNGSDYLTNTPLLEYMGSTGIPVVISTGMADQEDVDDGVAAARRGGKSPYFLLHCTSSYPTPSESTNLLRMVTLRKNYEVPVGFSDHTDGYQAACQAVSLGACMIEKHFSLDHDLPGPDHWFSSTPDEFARLVGQVRIAEARLGNPDIVPADVENYGQINFRLGVVASQNLFKGTRITDEMVRFCRPAGGLSPKQLHKYIGWKLNRDISAGDSLDHTDFSNDIAI